MSDKFISLDSLKEYNKQMKETYIKPLEDKTKDCPRVIKGVEVANGTYTSESMVEFGGAYGLIVQYLENAKHSCPTIMNLILDGVEYNNLHVQETAAGYAAGNLSKLNALIGTDYPDTGEPFIIGWDVGTCIFATDMSQSTTHSIVLYFSDSECEIVKLDEKYLPDKIVNQLNNLPRIETNWAEVINEDFTTVTDAAGNYSYYGNFTTPLKEIPTTAKVNLDGRVYNNLPVTPIPEMGEGIYGCGNLSLGNDLFGSSYPETKEPFVIVFVGENFIIATDITQSTTHNIVFYVPNGEVVIKLDEKYLPDSLNAFGEAVATEINSINTINERQQKELDGKVTIATFNITEANTTITLQNLIGMTEIDWGDGTVNSELSHTYAEVGMYICKIYDVTSIGIFAFDKCTSLTNITISNNITSIGEEAFDACENLIVVEIPNGVINIDTEAFRNCTMLTSIIIPDSVTSIGAAVFEGCTSLTEVIISNRITSIKNGTFRNCSSLISVKIPSSVTNISSNSTTLIDGVFYGCSSLKSIELPDGITNIGYGLFYNCSSLTEIVIPDSVTSIGSGAFRGCDSLTEIVIPNSVMSIGSTAFMDCTNLISAVFKAALPIEYKSKWFIGCSNLKYIYVPTESLDAYKTAWSAVANKIVDKVEYISFDPVNKFIDLKISNQDSVNKRIFESSFLMNDGKQATHYQTSGITTSKTVEGNIYTHTIYYPDVSQMSSDVIIATTKDLEAINSATDEKVAAIRNELSPIPGFRYEGTLKTDFAFTGEGSEGYASPVGFALNSLYTLDDLVIIESDIYVTNSETISATAVKIPSGIMGTTTAGYQWIGKDFPMSIALDPCFAEAGIDKTIFKRAEVVHYDWILDNELYILDENGNSVERPEANIGTLNGNGYITHTLRKQWGNFYVQGIATEADTQNSGQLTVLGKHMKIRLYSFFN